MTEEGDDLGFKVQVEPGCPLVLFLGERVR